MMSINILPKPSSNDAIYFSSKNNTRLSFFPSINNDANYYPSKKKGRELWVNVHVKKSMCILKESNTLIHVFLFHP